MQVEAVDFFYLAMPEVTTAPDGSQDALLVRVVLGGHVGWGECEAAPLPSMAAWACPMSHGACRPVMASVMGRRVEGPADIAAIARDVAMQSMDLLQAAHTWSGVEIALWDALGRARGEPVWALLGIRQPEARRPYASVLFGATPGETEARGRALRAAGYTAMKFGWAPFGSDLAGDQAQLEAARAGIGPDATLLIDAGQVFGTDVEAAALRLPALAAARAAWLEEPFAGAALGAYAALAAQGGVPLAGGEAAHEALSAINLIDFGRVGFVQIDTGRVGGIGAARRVADHAARAGVAFVNHTFTSSLALSASLQPYADHPAGALCEYPAEISPLARAITTTRLAPGPDGLLRLPDAPGLGVEVATEAIVRYRIEVDLSVNGQTLFRSP
jgi:L-alanine-DL-glutamate epimerase-like enolase superfamily enzyme